MSASKIIYNILQLKEDKLIEILSHIFINSDDALMLAMEWLTEHGEHEGLTLEKDEDDGEQDGIENELIWEYWSRAREIISEFNTLGGGPEEEESDAYGWLEEISQLIGQGKVGHAARMEVLDEALQEYFMGNSGFDDGLTDLCLELCQTAEEWDYYAGQLKAHPSRWNDRQLMDIYLNKLKDDTAYLEVRKRNLEYGTDYWDLGNFYMARNDMGQALQIMEQGILKGEGRCTELFQYLFDYYVEKNDEINILRIVQKALERRNEEKMILDRLTDYYLQQGNYAKGKEAMLKGQSFVGRHDYYKEYERLKKNLESADWMMIKETFLMSALQKSKKDYMQICIAENMKKMALQVLQDEVQQGGHPGTFYEPYIEIADQLQKDFPQEIIDYYWEEARRQIPGGNRKTYGKAARYLNKAKDIYDAELQDLNAWGKRFAALKEEFNNRPAFWDEVKHL